MCIKRSNAWCSRLKQQIYILLYAILLHCGNLKWCTCFVDNLPLLGFSQLFLPLLLLGCVPVTDGCCLHQQKMINPRKKMPYNANSVWRANTLWDEVSRECDILTTAMTTALWFSMSSTLFSLAHSNRVYIMAVPRLASTCSSSFDRISCFVSAELIANPKKEWKNKPITQSNCARKADSIYLNLTVYPSMKSKRN